jgi:hypothetical protein
MFFQDGGICLNIQMPRIQVLLFDCMMEIIRRAFELAI